MSRSGTLLGFTSRCNVSTDKQGQRHQQMSRQQPIKWAHGQKWMHTAWSLFWLSVEGIIGHNEPSFFSFSFCFHLLLRCSRNAITYMNLPATRENCNVWHAASHEQCHNVHILWWRHTCVFPHVVLDCWNMQCPTYLSQQCHCCWCPGALTHWGRLMHICIGKLTIIGSDNGLSPGRPQAIIWTNDGILLIGPLGTNFSEILIEIHTFSFKKMHLKMSSG